MTNFVDGIEVIQNAERACEMLQHDKVIGIDLETTGLSPWKDSIALVQLYGEDTGALAVIQTPNGVIPDCINGLFTPEKTFIVHNGVGFDLMFMHTHEIPWRNAKFHDTLVAETLLVPTGRRDVSKSLRASLRRRLGKDVDKTIEHGHWNADVLSDRQVEYAAQDVISLPALYRSHLKIAVDSDQVEALDMEMALMPTVARMTINGLPCSDAGVTQYVEEQKAAIAEADTELHEALGNINLGSTQQLQKALNGKFGFKLTSTAVEALIPLVQFGGENVAILETLLKWKHGNQRIKMYKPEWRKAHIVNDFVHPHFWQCSADTTRFTCSDPNLQQVPRDSRKIIGGSDIYDIVSVDYSQIEVRIAAYISQDAVLMEQLDNEDVHRAIAAAVFMVPQDEVTKDQRRMAKALSFTLLFGGGVQTLYDYSKMSGGSISYEQANDFVFRFFSSFQGLKQMKDKAIRLAQKPGPVFLRLPNRSRRILVGYTKRATVILNTMVQGSAAVGIKHGIIEAARRGLDDYLGGQVHDELVAAVPVKEAKDYAAELSEAMIVGMHKILPTTVKVEAKIGKYWS